MNFFASAISNKIFSFQIQTDIKICILLILFISLGCSSTKRFSDSKNIYASESNIIRVLLGVNENEQIISVGDLLLFSDEANTLAKVNSGNKIRISNSFGTLSISIADKVFESDVFFLNPAPGKEIIKIDGKKYR